MLNEGKLLDRTMLLIGGGLASATAALTLRADGFGGRVVLVGDEPHPPYSRPPLSKDVVRGERPPSRTHLRPSAVWESKDVELRLGVRVTGLDTDAHTARLSDGTLIHYDAALVATGGRARTLPGTEDLEGVHVLRTIDDSMAIRNALQPGCSVLVVGAGFVGAELAASARSVGADVTMLEALDQPLARALPPLLGQYYAEVHRRHGVDLHLRTSVEGIERADGRLRARDTNGRTHVADLVVVAIGLVPNTELASEAGLEVGNGIVVDERCRTSAPDVYAVGDVANFPAPLLGGQRCRIEHWQHAQHQAVVAARNMGGGSLVFAEVPWVWSDQYDLNLQVAGLPRADDEVIVRGDVAAHDFVAYLLREGALAAAVGVNRAEEVQAARGLIASGARVGADDLADPAVPLPAES